MEMCVHDSLGTIFDEGKNGVTLRLDKGIELVFQIDVLRPIVMEILWVL